jgi:prepilin-type N-terminal cleavage/methylation domain-containing protein
MNKKAFTLIEIMVAVVIIGIAITSILAGNAAFTQAIGSGAQVSTAEFLIEQIRELSAMLPVVDPETTTTTFGPEEGDISHVANYDDLDDFDGSVFNPPINTRAQTINDLAAYTQRVTVQNILNHDFTSTTTDHGSDFVRVNVDILLNGNHVTSASWIRAKCPQQ